METAVSASRRSKDQLRGFSLLAGACARAMACEPKDDVVDAVRRAARTLGDDRFGQVAPGAELNQRFYDRFFVSASPFFVPLHESSVRGAFEQDGRVRFAPAQGPLADHVLRCYRAVGFDHRAIEGSDLAVRQLRPDSMASELAFMSFLAGCAAQAHGRDVQVSARAEDLLRQFAHEHASCWFGAAADALRRSDDDFYARVCDLAAEATSAWIG